MPATPSHVDQLPVSRRNFLALAWKTLLSVSGLLSLSGLWRYLSYQPNPEPPSIFDLGLPDTIPPDSRAVIPEASAVVIRSEDEIKAFSLICPHLGCIVEATQDGFACPCHGSRFGKDGELIQGPAAKPLRQVDIHLDEQGHLILDASN